MKKKDISFVTRIDVGGGYNTTPGFVGVDIMPGSDIEADVCNMPFLDGQIEKIVCFHLLEHLPKDRIDDALSECYRVLKRGGVMVLEVPDFESIIQDWIKADENDRWGMKLSRIFGMQNRVGEFHQTGFTLERLKVLILRNGFEIKDIKSGYSDAHSSMVIAAVITK